MASNPAQATPENDTSDNSLENANLLFQEMPEDGWQELVETLLGTLDLPESPEIIVNDDDIVIQMNPDHAEKVRKALQDAIQSRGHFEKQLAYTLSVVETPGAAKEAQENGQKQNNAKAPSNASPESNASPQSSDPKASEDTNTADMSDLPDAEIPAPPANTLEEGLDKFIRIFSRDVIEGIALDPDALFDGKKGAYVKDGIMYSKPAKGEQVKHVWNDFLIALVASFYNVDIPTLRKIWTQEGFHLPKLPTDFKLNEGENFRGLIQQCFGIHEDENQSLRLFVNYGLLYHFIYPPKFKVEDPNPWYRRFVGTKQKAEIRIPKDHFFNYIKPIIQDKPLLHVYKDDENPNQVKGRPIFLGPRKANSRPHKFIKIMDRSGSMEGEKLEKLLDNSLKLSEEIASFDKNAGIRIVLFNDGKVTQEFPIQNKKDLEVFLKNVKAEGGTQLYKAFKEELRALLKDKNSSDNVVILWTDGMDNEISNAKSKLNTCHATDTQCQDKAQQEIDTVRQKHLAEIGKIFEEFEKQGENTPKCFTVGISDSDPKKASDYDQEGLAAIAKYCRTTFIHLKSPKDFNELFKYLDVMKFDRKLEEFFVAARRFTVPVMMDGNAKSPKHVFTFQKDQPVTLGTKDKQHQVKLRNSGMIPAPTINDKLNEFASSMLNVIAGPTVHPQRKFEFLSRNTKPFLDLFGKRYQDKFTPSQLKEYQNLQDQLKYYMKELYNIALLADDSGIGKAQHSSLMSKARSALGVYVDQEAEDPTAFASSGTPVQVQVDPNPSANPDPHQQASQFGSNQHAPVGPIRKILWVQDQDAETSAEVRSKSENKEKETEKAPANSKENSVPSSASRRAEPFWSGLFSYFSGHPEPKAANPDNTALEKFQAPQAKDGETHSDKSQCPNPPFVKSQRNGRNALVNNCHYGKLNGKWTMQCSNAEYQTMVFYPKLSTDRSLSNNFAPQNGDTYKASSCRSVEFYGRPAVYCEGETTSMIYRPAPIPSSLAQKAVMHSVQNADGTIGLAAVGINWGIKGMGLASNGLAFGKSLYHRLKVKWNGPEKDLTPADPTDNAFAELDLWAESFQTENMGAEWEDLRRKFIQLQTKVERIQQYQTRLDPQEQVWFDDLAEYGIEILKDEIQNLKQKPELELSHLQQLKQEMMTLDKALAEVEHRFLPSKTECRENESRRYLPANDRVSADSSVLASAGNKSTNKGLLGGPTLSPGQRIPEPHQSKELMLSYKTGGKLSGQNKAMAGSRHVPVRLPKTMIFSLAGSSAASRGSMVAIAPSVAGQQGLVPNAPKVPFQNATIINPGKMSLI